MLNKIFKRTTSTLLKSIQSGRFRQAHQVLDETLTTFTSKPETIEAFQEQLKTKLLVTLCELKMKSDKDVLLQIDSMRKMIAEAVYLNPDQREFCHTLMTEIFLNFLLLSDTRDCLRFTESMAKTESNKSSLLSVSFYQGCAGIINDVFYISKPAHKNFIHASKNLTRTGMALNNSAIACWWDKHPVYSSAENTYDLSDDETYDNDNDELNEQTYLAKKSDYYLPTNLFRTSIFHLEEDYENVIEGEFSYYQKFISQANPIFTNVKRMAEVDELLSCSFDTDNDFIKYNVRINDNSLLLNPLSAIPIFNFAEFTLSNENNVNNHKIGRVYLKFAFTILQRNMRFIEKYRENEFTNGLSSDVFRALYLDYEKTYRSLLFRAISFYSMISCLSAVGLKGSTREYFEKRN